MPMKMNRFFLSNLLVVVFVLGTGCDSEVLQDSDLDSGERVRFVLDGLDADSEISDNFELRSAIWNGKHLDISVAYSGGCKEHAFTLYSSAVNIAIYPPQIGVVLAHDGNGDSCEAYIAETISIDVSSLVNRMNGTFWVYLRAAGAGTGDTLALEYK